MAYEKKMAMASASAKKKNGMAAKTSSVWRNDKNQRDANIETIISMAWRNNNGKQRQQRKHRNGVKRNMKQHGGGVA